MTNTNKLQYPPPLHSVETVPVECLVLDVENPRLTRTKTRATDESIIAQLYQWADLGELLQSIAANGYLDIEPLIVLEQNSRLIVLEGNRRLASIRLFRDSKLVERIHQQLSVRIPVPSLRVHYRSTLDTVSVYRVASRVEARSFIGFKHINGAARWESYAKARFAAAWYRDGGNSLTDIANKIGDKHDTVKRMVNAIYVLEQAETWKVFALDDRMSPRFNFSHLYTALSRAPYMRFLGLEAAWSRYDPQPDPVPEEKIGQLSELLKWMYGSKEADVEPVIQSQNPDIKHLAEVLGNAEALAVLRTDRSLREAHASTQQVSRRFMEALISARHEIREAANSLRGFDGEDHSLLDIAEDIHETAETIVGRMRKKIDSASMGDE